MPTVDAKDKVQKVVPPAWLHRKVWTTKRKLMGNLIPFLFAAPFAVAGVALILIRNEVFGLGLVLFALSPCVAWVAMNYLGLYENRKMRREMQFKLQNSRHQLPPRRFFVGMATPAFTSLLDPHEDVGFLILGQDKVEFFGDVIRLSLDRHQVTAIAVRPNVHSIVGLGRWVCLEGIVKEKPVRLQVELREKNSLLANMILSKSLKKRLEQWLKE